MSLLDLQVDVRSASICRLTDSTLVMFHLHWLLICVSSQVYKEVQKNKAEERQKMSQSLASTNTDVALNQ